MLEDAVEYVAEAGRRGIDLLLFPETYPGPTTARIRYEVVPSLAQAAARHGVALAAGTTEKADDGENAYYVSHVVIDEDGKVKGSYRRTHPRSDVYEGVFRSEPFWSIDYRAGDELPVFDLGWGTIGVSICSEVFVPEIARSLALRGAEICLFPTGILIDDLGFTENWRTLVRARAIENGMFTATTMNLFPGDLRDAYCGTGLPPVDASTGLNAGHALIASPESVLAASSAPGILSADLDLARLRLMRASPEFPDGLVVPPPFRSLPSVFRLRRPELAGELVSERLETT